MPIVHTESLQPHQLSAEAQHQVYCGLDTCVTLEVFQELQRTWPKAPAIYDFERALQGPYLEIMQRGWAVDGLARGAAATELRARISVLSARLDTFARAIWDKPLNPRSPLQLRAFFYQALKLPEVWLSQKGERKLSTNREALEKLDDYMHARPIIACILAIRDLSKQLEVFETDIDPDGRFRASYNIAGTETGRPSSSANAFGTGGNDQNIAPGLRFVFTSDPGWKLCVIDLEQVEARDVGFFCGCLFDDWRFLDACEGGDLHTANSRLIWPERAWTGDLAQDRKLADEQFYREFSFRDMSKRGGHLSNYMGTAWTMARSLKIPAKLADDFQARYCRGSAAAYPAIPKFWQWIAQELQTTHRLVTPFGRERHFFGRPEDESTIREAIAFLPQSTTADRMNLGLWRIWRYMPQVRLLGQGYDSVAFQFRESEDEDQIIQRALELVRVELVSPQGRSYVVPGEAKLGWNRGSQVTHADVAAALAKGRRAPRLNPDGLVKWKLGKPDARRRATGLQRVMM